MSATMHAISLYANAELWVRRAAHLEHVHEHKTVAFIICLAGMLTLDGRFTLGADANGRDACATNVYCKIHATHGVCIIDSLPR